jgi:hypothetical protein
MEKEFIPYEQTLALQELELKFDKEIIMGYYRGNRLVDLVEYKFTIENYPHINFISTLLYQQAFRWFREKYNLDSYHIEPTKNSHNDKCYKVLALETIKFNGIFDSYKEAELECLKKLIEIVKNR